MGKSIIIATAIFSASYLLANLHTTRTTNEGTAYVVNNVTGGTKVCFTSSGGGCVILKIVKE